MKSKPCFYIDYVSVPTRTLGSFYPDWCHGNRPAELSIARSKNFTRCLGVRPIKRSPLPGNRISGHPYKENNTPYSTIPETQRQIHRDPLPHHCYVSLWLPLSVTRHTHSRPGYTITPLAPLMVIGKAGYSTCVVKTPSRARTGLQS